MLEACFFRHAFNFQYQRAKRQKSFIYTKKAMVSLLSSKKMGVLLSPKYPLGRRACLESKKTKILKNLSIRDIQNA